VYDKTANPVFSYRSEGWAIEENDRTEANEMFFLMVSVVKFTLRGQNRSENTTKQLQIKITQMEFQIT
jgi:hypothetical protein